MGSSCNLQIDRFQRTWQTSREIGMFPAGYSPGNQRWVRYRNWYSWRRNSFTESTGVKGTTKDIFNKREKPRALRSFDDKSHPSRLCTISSSPLFSFTLFVCIYLNSLPTRFSVFASFQQWITFAIVERPNVETRGNLHAEIRLVLCAITLFEKVRIRVK